MTGGLDSRVTLLLVLAKNGRGGNMNRSGFLTSISKMCITSTLQTASDVFCEKKKIAQETYIPYPFSLGDLPTLDY